MSTTTPDWVEAGSPPCTQWANGKACVLDAGHLEPCTSSSANDWDWLPIQPWSEITRGLWMGGSLERPSAILFDAVQTVHRNAPPASIPILERRWHFNDSNELPDENELADTAEWVVRQWYADKRILVRCHVGLNRSGLVIGKALISVGYTPDDAIHIIRARRSPHALSNPVFEAYLRSLA